MPNPLAFIEPALEVLGRNLTVLPATGAAVEYLQRPDQEEVDDIIINTGTEKVTAFLETPEPSPSDIYRSTPPLPRSERHLLRFFIDGSLRTYFLATAVEGARSFPIELAQVGAALVERSDDGQLRVRAMPHEVLLLVPHVEGRGLSTTVWQNIERLAAPQSGFRILDFDVPDALNTDRQRDPRDKAGAKARYRMHQLEIELIKASDEARGEDGWLILDGAVKLDQFIDAPVSRGGG